MPGKADTSKKTKKCSKREEAPVQQQGDGGVAAALVWRTAADAKGRKPPAQSQRTEKFIPQKPELGKAQSRGYVYPDESEAHCPPPQQHEENVLQALRGWPGARNEELDQFTQTELDSCREESGKKTKKKKKAQPEKVHLKITEPEKPDPYMTELIAHVFMSRAEQERLAKLAAEEEARNKQNKKSQPNGSNIKGNRTSQLRAIALATNVPVDPKDLWKMSKFKNAKAHLETTRKREKNKQEKDGDGEAENGCRYDSPNGDMQLRGYTPVDLPGTPGNKTPVFYGDHFASESPEPLRTDRSYDQYNYELEAY